MNNLGANLRKIIEICKKFDKKCTFMLKNMRKLLHLSQKSCNFAPKLEKLQCLTFKLNILCLQKYSTLYCLSSCCGP